ncbi:MAG: hypothetical protein ABUL73_02420 [Alphaproteobacteria bacterium]
MTRSLFRVVLISAFLLGAATTPSFAGGRDLPSREISPNATCHSGQVNGHDGWICTDQGVDYFCTTPRTVCWMIIPPGPYHRGNWVSSATHATVAPRAVAH